MTDNNSERIDILESILLKLHNGTEPDSVQEEFNKHFTGVSAIEISMMEHQLIYGDGPITFRDVLKLCNVHANLFKGTIKDGEVHDVDKPGHPVAVFKEENMALRSALLRINNILTNFKEMDESELNGGMINGLRRQFDILGQFENHYKRKEHLFFSMMEKYGHDAPPKVMWAKDDEIRDLFSRAYKQVEKFPNTSMDKLIQRFEDFEFEFNEMIFKEEAILINILLEALSTQDWYEIAKHSDHYGYAIIRPNEKWVPEEMMDEETQNDDFDYSTSQPTQVIESINQFTNITNNNYVAIETKKVKVTGGYLTLSFEPDVQNHKPVSYILNPAVELAIGDGFLSLEQVKLVFDYIPAKVTFFDKHNNVQFYNHKDDKGYSHRYKDDIGKNAKVIYSDKEWIKLEGIVNAFSAGELVEESFWFKFNDQFIHLDYKAILDEQGQYQGFIEIEQNIQPILDIRTEKWRNLLPESKVDKSLKSTSDLSLINQKHQESPLSQLAFNDAVLNFAWNVNNAVMTDDINVYGYDTPINIGDGYLTINQIRLIFNHLPFEITYVDQHHKFRYFNNIGPYDEMLFQRSPIEIGRDLEYCHPARVWPKVQRLSEDFRNQNRFVEPMWFTPAGKLIYILYYGTQDHEDHYRGILETVQDASTYLCRASSEKPFI